MYATGEVSADSFVNMQTNVRITVPSELQGSAGPRMVPQATTSPWQDPAGPGGIRSSSAQPRLEQLEAELRLSNFLGVAGGKREAARPRPPTGANRSLTAALL